MRGVLLGLLAITFACSGPRTHAAGTDPASSTRPWFELQTEHVVVWTDLTEPAAREMAAKLEWFRRAMLLVWGPEVNPREKMRVIVLAEQRALAAYGAERYEGAFSSTPLGPHLILAAHGGYLLGDSGASETVTKHELAHAVMYLVLKHQPRWVSEGLAGYLETVHVQADGQVILGRANVNRLGVVRGSGRIPFAALRHWDRDDALRESDLGAHYASAWAWVHFLFNAHPERFVDYLQRLQRTTDAHQAWSQAFDGVPDAQLERELSVHLSQGRGVLVTVPFPGVDKTVAVRPLARADVQVAHALLQLAIPGRPVEERRARATTLASAALQVDPEHAQARRLHALLTGTRPPPSAEETLGGTATIDARSCPEDIVREPALEQTLPVRSGDWIPEVGPQLFGRHETGAGAPTFHRLEARVRGGNVAFLARSNRHGASAAVVRPVEEGGCVVNTWSTNLPDTELTDVAHWVARDGKHAVFLLKLKEQKGPPRWVALATDGRRMWPALSGGGGIHFLAKSARLRPQSGKLYLDVMVRGPGSIVFALREEGYFEQLGAKR